MLDAVIEIFFSNPPKVGDFVYVRNPYSLKEDSPYGCYCVIEDFDDPPVKGYEGWWRFDSATLRRAGDGKIFIRYQIDCKAARN